MKSNPQQTIRIGLFFLLGLALIWVAFETLSGGSLFKPKGYELVAGFDNLRNLKVGDDVRLAGVKVGAVTQTRLHNREAEAVLRINPDVAVASDATATIAMNGLLGSNYIAISLGSAGVPALAPGASIRTADTPDLNAVMTQLGDVGKKVEAAIDQFGSAMNGSAVGGGLFGKLNSLVDTDGPRLTQTIENLQDITAKIRDGQGTIGKLVNDPSVHDQMVAALGQIQQAAGEAHDFLASANAIATQIKSGQGTLGELVFDDQVGQDFKTTIHNVREISDKINRGQGTIGRLISDDSLYFQAQGVIKKANSTLDGLNDSGPITAVGIAAKTLF